MLCFDNTLPLSPYYELYDMLVKKDDKYRNAIDPVILFKYLVVKSEEDMSDYDLVEDNFSDLENTLPGLLSSQINNLRETFKPLHHRSAAIIDVFDR